MNSLVIEGTPKTPSVNFDAAGLVEIKGRSIPENSIEFYKPLSDWLTDYEKEAQPVTTVNIRLEYFNTSSSKCILDIFKKLEVINKATQGVTINWYYEPDDEDMLEAGRDYESIIRVPFQMMEAANV